MIDNNITDIAVIENYPALVGVYLDGNPLASIEPLRNAKTLKNVVLNNIGIDDYSLLAEHTNLIEVEISHNNVTDVSFLAKSKDTLQIFYAESNAITDLSPLKDAANLQIISLINNPDLKDISPLENAPRLVVMVLADTAVTDLTHINPNISGLYISHDEITDLAPLVKATRLTQWYAADTKISDVSYLHELPFLSSVILDSNRITDLRSVAQLPYLQFSVADQEVQLSADATVGQPTSLALFNPDGSVPQISWVTPGRYDPQTETLVWDNPGLNMLTWNESDGSLYLFSGTLLQYTNSRRDAALAGRFDNF